MGAYLITQVLLQFPSHTARIRTVNISVYLSLLTAVWIISWTLRNRALPAVIEPPLLLLIYDLKGNDNVSATKIITIIALRCFRSSDWIMTGSLVWVFGFQPLDNWQTFKCFFRSQQRRDSAQKEAPLLATKVSTPQLWNQVLSSAVFLLILCHRVRCYAVITKYPLGYQARFVLPKLGEKP